MTKAAEAESLPVGTPLGAPRTCVSCRDEHPPGTTCAGGWAPWRKIAPVSIELTSDDMAAAESHAREVMRAVQGTRFRNKFSAADVGLTELEKHSRGFAAEIAGARATGLSGPHWEVLSAGYRRADKNRDIGQRTDVKQTRARSGPLWVRDGDRSEYLYLLVTGVGPRFDVVGWIEGVDAMHPRWWVDRKPLPAWAIPQYALWPLPVPQDA